MRKSISVRGPFPNQDFFQKTKRNLLGAIETAVFMKQGVARFTKNSLSMKHSFLVPLCTIFPLTLVMVFAGHPSADLSLGTEAILAVIYSMRQLIYLIVFPLCVYVLAKATDRLDGFSKFVTAQNWLALPCAFLILPLVWMMASGSHEWGDIQPMVSLITLYSSAYLAFMIKSVMRMPWELSAFVAITGIAVHQGSLDILKWAAESAVLAMI